MTARTISPTLLFLLVAVTLGFAADTSAASPSNSRKFASYVFGRYTPTARQVPAAKKITGLSSSPGRSAFKSPSSIAGTTVWQPMHRRAECDQSLARSLSAMRAEFKLGGARSSFEPSAGPSTVNRSSVVRSASQVAPRATGAQSVGAYRNRMYTRR
ncbi:MAG: hypothetical protein L0Y42_01335 [Phycisphaerales bacterium]|nr:hypothetical protein [Phycisphaerales bacterium]